MFAKSTGFEPGELVHVIADAHIYDRHIPIIKELIANQTHAAPEVSLADGKAFYEYTPDDLIVQNYQYSEFNHKFEVAI